MTEGAPACPTALPRRPWAALLVLGTLTTVCAGRLVAQVADVGERKEAMATRIDGEPPRIDGRLEDAAWRRAVIIDDFRQRDPVLGAQPSERTEIAFLYDDDAIYIGARMYSGDPARIPAQLTRRDGFGHAEYITVSLDPFLDRRTAFSFTITAGNGRRDFLHVRDSDDFFARDYTWDPVWEARAVRDSAGWTAELRIPLSQLRFTRQQVQSWGLNVSRGMPQKNEEVYWVVVPRNVPGYISHFGTLTALASLRSSRRLEVLPYVAGSATFTGNPQVGNPFNDGRVTAARVGGDIKMGLGPSLTLDATFNPDFGQVEADPAEVNLSAFETFQNERRPFFTEGRQLLTGGSDGFFYSRRVGAPPRGPATGSFVDRPRSTRILGAAKLTGRFGAGWQLGLFAAVTERTSARTYDAGSDTFGRTEVEPLALWTAGRVQRQFGPNGSTAGATLAGMRRAFTEGSPLPDLFSRAAVAGSGDFLLRSAGGAWSVSGRLGFSHVEGEPAAILILQRSSARYFQRPDAGHVAIDSGRTSLTGISAGWRVSKNAGPVVGNINFETDSPGFETNDIGRLQNADDLSVSAEATLRQTEPASLFRRSRVTLSGRNGWNYGGIIRDQQLQLQVGATFHNYWDGNLQVRYNPRVLSDNLTRGGPRMEVGWRVRTEGSVSTNQSSSRTARLQLEYEAGEFGAWDLEASLRLSASPTPTLSLSADPYFRRLVSPRQYVGQFADGGEATFGGRYLFARIDRSQLSMRLRLSYLFSQGLSLEAYAEPFAASGRYSGFGELAAADSRFLREYGTAPGTTITATTNGYQVADQDIPGSFSFGNPDFNSLSFRSNLVLRWEWRPGSTLFLVWQQSRSEFCSASVVTLCPNGTVPGTAPTLGRVRDPFAIAGDNFLAAKVSYWLPSR